ncbi:MAG: glycosyltransferase [Oscillospiraceae bacterium]|nr:glycosyltransferase [Oscillospiraceae bacterium]
MAIEETIACVKSIDNNINGNKKIIVVDNASPNASGKELKKIYSESETVEVLLSKENLGFAKGNNIGYKYAVDKYHPDFIVVMNNDMEIKQKDFISCIEKSYEKHHFAIMGPDVYSTKMEYHQNPQTRKLMNLEELKKSYNKLKMKEKLLFVVHLKWYIKHFLKLDIKDEAKEKERKMSRPFINEIKENIMLHGSCYVFSDEYMKLHKRECFYSGTFMYMEAEILYYLAKKNNEKIVYDPSMKVFHHEDISTNATFKRYQKSVFSVKCLKQSTKAFIDLIENGGNIK